ncbi:MAG: STAS domain-containing protein [Bryobacteraceae bacterium]|nr:STAS domain-containing protein [Bryobacteraceae bacterium]
MEVEFGQREIEGIVILDLKGRLVAGGATTSLRDKVTSLLAEGKNRIVLNLKEVDYIDSSGLGSMVICYTSAKKHSGMLKLLHLNRRNVELLVLTKLTTVFEIHNDEQAAVNSFFPNREIRKFDILAFLQQQKDIPDE